MENIKGGIHLRRLVKGCLRYEAIVSIRRHMFARRLACSKTLTIHPVARPNPAYKAANPVRLELALSVEGRLLRPI